MNMKNVVALLSALTVMLSTAAPLTAAELPQTPDTSETTQDEAVQPSAPEQTPEPTQAPESTPAPAADPIPAEEPAPQPAEKEGEVRYEPSFASEEGQDWFFTNSKESISFNGEMTITKLDQYAVDMNSPDIQDGTYSVVLKASELYNLTLVARYKDPDNLITMGFGGNNVLWCSRVNGQENYGIKDFSFDYGTEEYVHVKMKFEGAHMTLYLNGYKAYEGDFATYTGAGKCGLRTWNGTKDITVKSILYTDSTADLYTGLNEAYAALEEARTYKQGMYTPESFAALQQAIQQAADQLAQAEMSAQTPIPRCRNN